MTDEVLKRLQDVHAVNPDMALKLDAILSASDELCDSLNEQSDSVTALYSKLNPMLVNVDTLVVAGVGMQMILGASRQMAEANAPFHDITADQLFEVFAAAFSKIITDSAENNKKTEFGSS